MRPAARLDCTCSAAKGAGLHEPRARVHASIRGTKGGDKTRERKEDTAVGAQSCKGAHGNFRADATVLSTLDLFVDISRIIREKPWVLHCISYTSVHLAEFFFFSEATEEHLFATGYIHIFPQSKQYEGIGQKASFLPLPPTSAKCLMYLEASLCRYPQRCIPVPVFISLPRRSQLTNLIFRTSCFSM